MKLINSNTGFIVVEFRENKPFFHDRFLEMSLQKRGINIPPILRSEYHGKAIVRLDDEEFQKAFTEIYCPRYFNPDLYQWN